MNNNRYKLLHYVLIILLMFAPLRSVMAGHCNMAVSSGNTVGQEHDMSAMLSMGSMPEASMSWKMKAHACCDDVSISCSGSCDMGVSVSLTVQEISYTPVYKDSFRPVSLSSKTLFRELTPPSRPPLKLS